jgi:hypothetical protein
MSEGSRARRREEKKRLEERPRVGGDIKENAMEEYLQFVHEVCELHCQDAANFDAASLRQQLKELSDGFASRHQLMSAPFPTPITVPSPLADQLEKSLCRKETSSCPEESSPQRSTPRQDSDELLTPVPSKKKVHYDATDRIALQQFQNGKIREEKHTNLPDQGIRFNKDGCPWDKYQSPSRDSCHEKKSSGPPREPASSHAGSKGSPGGGDSGGDNSSDGHSTSDMLSDEDEESDSPSSDEEDDSNRQSR